MRDLNTKELNEISFDMTVFLNMFEGMSFSDATKEAHKQLQQIQIDQKIWEENQK